MSGLNRARIISSLTRRGRLIRLTVLCLLTVALLFVVLPKMAVKKQRLNDILPQQLVDTERRVIHHNAGKPVMLTDGTLGNFEPPPEPQLDRPGEGGRPHHLEPNNQNEAQDSEVEYGMNVRVSDEVSLERSIPDTRMTECKHWQYPTDLPTASVVLVFHNEGFSVLMRTVHTILLRSPPALLHEVVLVDDFSDKADLGAKLEQYIGRFNGKVKLYRNSEREGLIRTRNRGAELSRGEVVVFLDAHCEVNINWLPPLLAPIARDRTTMTVPVIDGIDHSTFEYRPVYQGQSLFRGIFEWGMLYKETAIPQREASQHEHRSEPYRSPTHAGGLFAIDRSYFKELGMYDPGLLVWGGENFELSFKIWQCGGSILWVPCSKVGHVYRGHMPYTFGDLARKAKGPLVTINYKRVIETWFDDKHKEFFYTRQPSARTLDHGDISQQLLFKQQHNCHSFQWFIDNVAYDVLGQFPELPPNLHWGELRNVGDARCLDTMGRAAPTVMGVSGCHGYGNNQLARLNSEGQLSIGERCVESSGQLVQLRFCQLGTVNGPWRFDENSGQMLHTRSDQCLAIDASSRQLRMAECDERDVYRQWKWGKLRR